MSQTLFERAAALAGQVVQKDRLVEAAEILANGEDSVRVKDFVRAWKAARLSGKPQLVSSPKAQHCPFVVFHADAGWLLVLGAFSEGGWTVETCDGQRKRMELSGDIQAVQLPPRMEQQGRSHVNTVALVREAIMRRKGVFVEAILATVLIDCIALTTSIFSMQVYDRVIPSQGYNTLLVLGVGVLLAIILGLMLNCVRSVSLDHAATKIDVELSEWFFQRALGIRMDARPQSIGAFASQIKGLELLRGVLCSTSLFVLADVPFSLFFVFVIYLIGGPVALVPLIFIPVSLLIGMTFQRKINKASAQNQELMNSKTGLLVEALDGIESLKANGAEWNLLSRWNRIAKAVGEGDNKLKTCSAMANYFATAIQQVGYVSLVVFGVYRVVENNLTMGGLLACSIISSRALSPMVKLPGVMVQWANLRAVKGGLDKLISRPNEMDEASRALSPQRLEGSLRMENVLFAYMGAERRALQVPSLVIKPGERVGVVGAIGSGKSTLLKIASGLYRPKEGRVFIGGVDAAQLSPQRLRGLMAYVPQDVRLVSGTLRENILQGLPDPGDDALLQAIQETGLDDLVTHHPKGLSMPVFEGGRGISGGQRQLIALTRMVLAQPSLILLDEPTASMDSATEARIVALLERLSREGATLIVATHRSAVLPIVDRLLVFDHGKFAIEGPREAVLAHLGAGGSGLKSVGVVAKTPNSESGSKPDLENVAAKSASVDQKNLM